MVKFKIHSNPQGQYYLPKEIREELGENLDVICNARAAVIFNSNTPLEQVLRSVEVLRSDLENRVRNQNEEHHCDECGHWNERCLKGYSTRENEDTLACREFIPRKGS